MSSHRESEDADAAVEDVDSEKGGKGVRRSGIADGVRSFAAFSG